MSEHSTSGTPRDSLAIDRGLALASLSLLGALAVVGGAESLAVRGSITLVATLVVAVAWRFAGGAARSVAVLVAALCGACLVPVPWQPVMLLAMVVYGVATQMVPSIAPSPAWRAKGTWSWPWALVVGGVTPAALLAWVALLRPDLSDVRAMVPNVSVALLLVGGVAFSLVNATLEELVWRGALQDRLRALFSPSVAVVLQAISFGVQHAHGVPRGAVGVVLAGGWAVLLGALREKSGGLAAPIVAHVIADAAIAVIILARIGA